MMQKVIMQKVIMQEGYNQEGYDAEGYDAEGYNAEGYNQEGYDAEGYNAEGYDAEGYNAEGYNVEGYDAEGYDAEGYDAEGYDAEGYNREGYDAEGYNREDYDAEGFNSQGYNKEGYNREGYDAKGYDAQGYNVEGYNKEGYNVEGYNKEGFNVEGFDKEGYDQSGFNKEGYDRERFNREGYDVEGYNREGFSATGYNRLGFNKSGFNREGYDKEGFDVNGFNKEGIDREGFNTQGFNAQGYDREGYNAEGFNAEGYNRSGFNMDGFDVEGYDTEGYDIEGFDRTGYDREGYNREGINADGYKRNGEYTPTYDEKGRPVYVDEALYKAAYNKWLEELKNQENYIKSLKADYDKYSKETIGFDPTGTPFDVAVIDADGTYNSNPYAHISSSGEDEYGFGMSAEQLEALKKQIALEEDKLRQMQSREPQLGEPSVDLPKNVAAEKDLPELDAPDLDRSIPEGSDNLQANDVVSEPESLVVTTTNNGAQILIVKDPETGGWINSETGNDFDLEKFVEESPEQFKRVEDFIKHNDNLDKTGQTAMHKALENIQKKYEDSFIKIQKEIDQRRMEQLKRDMVQLEYAQQAAAKQNNFGKILGDTVINIGNESVDAAVVIGTGVIDGLVEAKEIAKDIWKYDIISRTVKGTYNDLAQYHDSGKKMLNKLKKDIIENPMIVVDAGIYIGKESALLVGKTGKAVIDTLRDPKKMLDFVKDSAGYNDIIKSWDPNLNIFQRFKHLAIGGIKLGSTVSGIGKAGSVLKGKLAGVLDDIVINGKKAILPKGINPKLPTQFGPKYVTSPRVADLDGITETSRKIIQNTADDFGVQIHTRPTTPYAKRLLDAGDAMPKPPELKAKTLSKLDELIGGPKYSDGVVGYYKPQLPKKEIWNKLSESQKKDVAKLYRERRREFTKLAKDMKELEKKGYSVINKKVVKDGKLFTGDVDVYDITNYDGTPINPKMKAKILDIMEKKRGSNIMHEDLVSWSKDSKVGTLDLKAKAKMINAAGGTAKNAKGLTTFNPLSKTTNSVHFDTPIPVAKIDNFLAGKLEGITPSEMETLKALLKSSGMGV
jgi:hypothetical protein